MYHDVRISFLFCVNYSLLTKTIPIFAWLVVRNPDFMWWRGLGSGREYCQVRWMIIFDLQSNSIQSVDTEKAVRLSRMASSATKAAWIFGHWKSRCERGSNYDLIFPAIFAVAKLHSESALSRCKKGISNRKKPLICAKWDFAKRKRRLCKISRP